MFSQTNSFCINFLNSETRWWGETFWPRHPGVRVRNVRRKFGPKSLCLCCSSSLIKSGSSVPGDKFPYPFQPQFNPQFNICFVGNLQPAWKPRFMDPWCLWPCGNVGFWRFVPLICPETITKLICVPFLRCKDNVTAPENNSPRGPSCQELRYRNHSNPLCKNHGAQK